MCTTQPQFLQDILKKMGVTDDAFAKLFKDEQAEGKSIEAARATEMRADYAEMQRPIKRLRLANKIEAAMKTKGLNRTTFATLMQVQPSLITRWLSGSHNFTVETLYRIEEKLNIQLI